MVHRKLILRIDFDGYAALRAHAEEAYPNECCGVLLGRFGDSENTVAGVVACANARQDSPHNRYAIAPLDLIRIQRDARNQGLEIIGFYHSHPDHPAQWSSTDLAEAHWLGCSYLIAHVANGKATDTRSFRLLGAPEQSSTDQKHFLEESIQISG